MNIFANIIKANTEIARLNAAHEQAQAALVETTQVVAERDASIVALTARAEKAETELATANARLANPAGEIANAVTEELSKQGIEQPVAVTEQTGAPTITAEKAWQEYKAEADPDKKRAIYLAHRSILRP